jgi:hypothetical protein
MHEEHFMDVLKTAINSGRNQMKTEILEQVFKLVEDYANKNDEDAMRIVYKVHNLIRGMPTRIQDKQQQEIAQ